MCKMYVVRIENEADILSKVTENSLPLLHFIHMIITRAPLSENIEKQKLGFKQNNRHFNSFSFFVSHRHHLKSQEQFKFSTHIWIISVSPVLSIIFQCFILCIVCYLYQQATYSRRIMNLLLKL